MSTRPSPLRVNEPATADVLELSPAQRDLNERAMALAREATAPRATASPC